MLHIYIYIHIYKQCVVGKLVVHNACNATRARTRVFVSLCFCVFGRVNIYD